MRGRSHLASGVAAGIATVAAAEHLGVHLTIWQDAAVVATVAVGSLLPDLDSPRSIASRVVPLVSPAASWAVRLLSAAVYRATRTRWDDQAEGTHRYLTHTAVFAGAVGVLAGIAAASTCGWWWLGVALALGCLVHLWGDWITVMGVPLLWPLKHRGKRWWRYRLPGTRIHSGHAFELRVMVPLFAVAGTGASWLALAGVR